MITSFDLFGQQEKPNLILCNPNKTELESLGLSTETKLSLRLNGISELSFKYPRSIDNNQTVLPAFDLLKSKRLIYVENVGYFIIQKANKDLTGGVPKKEVVAYSIDAELINKKLSVFKGTYAFYDTISPSASLLGKVVALLPNWSIGEVDSELAVKFRTFDISDTTIYDFLVSDVETAYGCVITFDYFNRRINAKLTSNVTIPTDIYLSFDNLLKTGSLTELSDEITTCLNCYGAGDLDIRTVNPLGGVAIYNFNYYKTTEWMSQGLIDALNAWDLKVTQNQAMYSYLLASLKSANSDLLTLKNTLADLQTSYASAEGVQKTQIAAGWASAASGSYEYTQYQKTLASLTSIQTQIDNQQAIITAKEKQISNPTAPLGFTEQLNNIVNSLKLSANFTTPQLQELDTFTFQNTYQNENIIQTSQMTPFEIQEKAESLYAQSKEVLAKVSQPRFEFSVDAVNFTALKEFASFTNQLELGAVVNIELHENDNIEAVLLEINLNFDNPSDFSLTFSNRLRLDNGVYRYSDILGTVTKTGSSVSFDKGTWSDWTDNYQTDVSKFIESALDASKNAVVNSTNQEIIINSSGLRGRTVVDPNAAKKTYQPTQVWLTSNTMAFTKDAWKTASLALGEITVNNTKQFGLVAGVIVGNLVASNKLVIESEKKDGGISVFKVDGNGASLYNASLGIANKKNTITIDPNYGILITNTETKTTQFYLDDKGNVIFAGNLKAAGGTFTGELSAATGSFAGSVTALSGSLGGFTIKSDGLYSPGDTYYLKSNGDLKWGDLDIKAGVMTFNGLINASQIKGQLIDAQISSGIDAGKMTFGSMSGDRIYAGTISSADLQWPGGSISNNNGATSIAANFNIGFKCGESNPFTLAQNWVSISGICQISNTLSVTSSSSFSGKASFSGGLTINGYNPYNGDIYLGPSYSDKRLQVVEGVIVNVYIL